MAFKQSENFHKLLHLLVFFSLSCSKTTLDLDTICNNTLYPSFCISILTNSNLQPNTIHDYGRFWINQSLNKANNFKLLVNIHLQSPNKNYASQPLIHALEDCHFLTSLNINFLSTIANTINLTNSLSSIDIHEVQTMLSAAITNLDTCSNSLNEAQLQSSVVHHDLITSQIISTHTMFLSLSLDFFTNYWMPKHNTDSYLLTYDQINGREVYQDRRRLLELGCKGIVVSTKVVVNPYGSGDYTTINDAIKAAPKDSEASDGYFEIYVVAGVYEEYVDIPTNKQYVLMVGEGINQTIITGNRSAEDGWSTFKSATFAVTGKGFVAINITIRNTAGPNKYQAVAMRSGADLSAFYKCSFEGYQDTLYSHSLRQFYKECDIYGTIDFIFGNAAAVLQDCNIFARRPLEGQTNVITAQGRTDPNQITGFSIHNCKIMAADDLLDSNFTTDTYCGRPWKEYSRTVIMQSYMGNLIAPAGWLEWSGSYALDTLYYAEYNNIGPGSNIASRVTWPGYHVINDTIASYFTVSYFIVGNFWLPFTGVPYVLDLLS